MARSARTGVPAWATTWLRRQGYRPGNVMDPHVARWWSWFDCSADFYKAAATVAGDTDEHMTLHPARAVCDEWSSLLLNESTALSSDDSGMAEWLGERMGPVLGDSADFVARCFALGSGAWSLDFSGDGSGVVARVRIHDACSVVPLAGEGRGSASCAFVSRVEAAGEEYDQVQVHEPDPATGGTYHVRTWLFPARSHAAPVAVEGVVGDLDTRSELPTYAICRPAIANTYEDNTPLGVSVFDDAVDSVKAVDEAFDTFYWSLRLGHPSVFLDERSLIRDERGRVLGSDSVAQRLFRALDGPISDRLPVTFYNPDLRVQQAVDAVNLALSLMSWKCGLGPGYFSFDMHQGLKTATEVVADNAPLARNIRRHEKVLGDALVRLARGAWAAERGISTGAQVRDADVPRVEVQWDDSVIEDEASERATMKDDIARGLAPAWIYPVRYYGMGEEEARALTSGAGFPEEM